MTTLYLLRHGQASALADEYDQLSPIGEQQAERLGAHLGAHAPRGSRVLIGPRRRHAQTLAGMRRGAPSAFADETLEPALDEHHGVQLVKQLTPLYAERDHPFGEAIRAVMKGGPDAYRAVGRMYQVALTGWARGELEHGGDIESWSAFRARTGAFLRTLIEGDDDGTLVAVTSGGAIGAIVAEAIGAPDERALDLMWSLKNASITRLRFSHHTFTALEVTTTSGPRTVHLEVFNETGHLGIESRLHTHV